MTANYFNIVKSLENELKLFEKLYDLSVEREQVYLKEMLADVMQSKGKRIRPLLLFLIAKNFGSITRETILSGVAIELLHTATLIHDDIVDDADTRRDKPSLKYTFGNHNAVLVGDYLLSSALINCAKTRNIEVIEQVSQLGKTLSEGEIQELYLANNRIIDEKSYFEVISKKTASLLRSCMMIGAIMGGADEETKNTIGLIGEYLGISFQLKDDIFDYYDDVIGKPTASDLIGGKVTLPLIYALKNSASSIAKPYEEIIKAQNYTSENIQLLISFAKDNGGIDYTERLLADYYQKVRSLIESVSLNDETKAALTAVLQYNIDRKY